MIRDKGTSIIEILDDYTVIDIETTGLSFGYDEIIEIGAIRVRNGEEVAKFSKLVQPKDFELFDSDFTGIKVNELKCANFIEDIIPSFLDFIKTDVLVGANINSFDINFLYDVIYSATKKKLKNNVVDIFRFSRKLLPELGLYPSLELISNHLGFDGNHHRALDDCGLTYKCYEYFKSKIRTEQLNINELFKPKISRYKVSDLQCEFAYIDEDNLFYKKVVVITGALNGKSRKDAQQMIKNMGGDPKKSFVTNTDYLIVGTLKKEETEKLKRFKQAKLKGHDVKIIDGNEFLEYCKEYFNKIEKVKNN